MFTWRIRRQLSYLLIVFLFFLSVFGVIYFFYKTPASCFDGRKNQDENEIDCGGSCQRICSSTVLPLKTAWVRPFEISTGIYTVVALVENDNLSEGIKNLYYTIKLFDQLGREITDRRGSATIFPQSQTAIFESRIETDKQIATRAFVDFSKPLGWEKFTEAKPALKVSQKQYLDSPTPRLTASVVNDSNNTLKNLQVVVVLSDSSGNAYTTSATLVDDLPALSNREIFFTWPKPFSQSPAFVDFYTHILADY